MDPQRLAMLLSMMQGRRNAMGGTQNGPPGNPLPMPNPAPAPGPTGNTTPTPQGSLGPPKANPGAMLSAAGMQAAPTDAPMPARPGDMQNPAAPTTDEPTSSMGPLQRQGIPMFQRNPLGALLIPGLISGG